MKHEVKDAEFAFSELSIEFRELFNKENRAA